jgi:hypothetical protein
MQRSETKKGTQQRKRQSRCVENPLRNASSRIRLWKTTTQPKPRCCEISHYLTNVENKFLKTESSVSSSHHYSAELLLVLSLRLVLLRIDRSWHCFCLCVSLSFCAIGRSWNWEFYCKSPRSIL